MVVVAVLEPVLLLLLTTEVIPLFFHTARPPIPLERKSIMLEPGYRMQLILPHVTLYGAPAPSTLINELSPPFDDPVTRNHLSTKNISSSNNLLPKPY
jgi:hypothetical protein